MTDEPRIIEWGPRHRVLDMPSGERIIQYVKEYTTEVTIGWNPETTSPEIIAAHTRVIHSLLDARMHGGEMIDRYITEWAPNFREGDGVVRSWTARVGIIYWPALKGH